MIQCSKRCSLLLLGSLLSLSALWVQATLQQPDVIVIDDVSHALNTNPLEPYLATFPERPKGLEFTSTALWRGYVATWVLKDGRLLLQALGAEHLEQKGKGIERRQVDLWSVVFPTQEPPVVADWYTGALIVPVGKVIGYLRFGHGSISEQYFVVSIRKGIETERLNLSGEEFRALREHRFRRFQATEEYRRLFDHMYAENRDGNEQPMSRQEIDLLIRDLSSHVYMWIDSPEIEERQ